MSNNLYVYTYQHTCNKGHQAYILKNAPFKAPVRIVKGKKKIPFLGEGYYLWEENMAAAHRWGQKHYNNIYSIVEYKDLEINDGEFLDLTDRRQLEYFKNLQDTFTSKRPESASWKLGQWIEFFKFNRQRDHALFPFNYIKADEHLPDIEENQLVRQKVFFSEGMPYFTYFSPLYMLCVIDKKQMKFDSETFVT
ncbi:hypothetical protein [Flavobacterium sp. AG291]|uniref:hypothetical protein n=1 Tax=Flavobacterium sp. AG291 TaxID=2184000 RepID=UPI000E0C9B76|nr:hypothetical protein [Flavobacterium sp. AG291]RDI07032.1 hypothetical protein DEU42_113132 [Flavobacterium sp. AG291]